MNLRLSDDERADADLFSFAETPLEALPVEPESVAANARQVHGDDADYLRGKANVPAARSGSLAFVDFFSGCGGLSLGVSEACRAAGISPFVAGAVDSMPAAHAVYASNFGSDRVLCGDIGDLMPRDASEGLTDFEKATLAAAGGRIGVVVGGPPCQGHSDLNNYTRRDDPKNELYLYMGRAGVGLRPEALLIENVAGSPHDKNGVVGRTIEMLVQAGYKVDAGLVDLSTLGVAQTRKRYLILATLKDAPPLASLLRNYLVGGRDLAWAIGDLADAQGAGIDLQVAKPSKDNAVRIDYLFDNDLRDLPNSQRPPCHRDKVHAYNSVYGRLSWDRPAQTVTSGFYSMCMGRYVHPSRRRTLTAREAARIQFFPDTFDFAAAGSRTALAKIIGNAVPMKLTYAVVSELIRLGVVTAGAPNA